MTPVPVVASISQVKVPVTDVERSARWYAALLALVARCDELGATHGQLVDRGSDCHHPDVTDPDGEVSQAEEG